MGNLEYERLHENLRQLGLFKMEQILDGRLEKAAGEGHSILQTIDSLVQEELDAKSSRYFQFQMRLAHFPYRKTLEEFDFSFQPSIDKKTIAELAGLRFVFSHENVVFLGPPGVGKTHIAISLGLEALKGRMAVKFLLASELLQKLRAAQEENTLRQVLGKLNRNRLLILDEMGYLPMDKTDANLFFQLVASRYEKGSMVITSNLPFRSWGEMLGDEVIASAVLDRLLHHCTVVNIKGESYRIKDRRRVGLAEKGANG